MATATIMAGTAEKLRENKFFRNMNAVDLEKLSAICRVLEFPARCTVFEEYAPAEDVYVVTSGEISLAICEPDVSCRQIAVVVEGDLMGWSPLVGRARLYDTARSVTPVEMLAFNGPELMEFCAANPSFGFEFMRRAAVVLAQRLSATRLQLLNMSGTQLPMMQPESD